MQPIPFEAIYEVALYTDDILIDQFDETVNVIAFNTEEAYTIAKNLLYDKLVHKRPEVPYENYVVKLKSFNEDPQREAKNKILKISSMFYLATGLEFLFATLCIRHILIASLLSGLALYFDKPFLTYTAYGVTAFAGCNLLLVYKKLLTKISYTWLNSVVLLTSLLQAIIFWV